LVIFTEEIPTLVDDQREQNISVETLADDRVIADVIETQIKMAERDAEWKKAAEVLNIYSLIIHVLVVLSTFCLVFIDPRHA
jgi:hypothetical protein